MRSSSVMAVVFVLAGGISYFLNELNILIYPPEDVGDTHWNVGFILCVVFLALAIWLIIRGHSSARSRTNPV